MSGEERGFVIMVCVFIICLSLYKAVEHVADKNFEAKVLMQDDPY